MTIQEIELEIARLLSLEGKTKTRLVKITNSIAKLQNDKKAICDAELHQREIAQRELRIQREKRQDRQDAEDRAIAEARYNTEPEIYKRLVKAAKRDGFIIQPKLNPAGQTVGLRLFLPFESPDVDLLEKWGYPPTLRGAADFLGVLRHPGSKQAA